MQNVKYRVQSYELQFAFSLLYLGTFGGSSVRGFSPLQFNIGKAAEQTVGVDVLVLFKSGAAPSLISVDPHNLWKKQMF